MMNKKFFLKIIIMIIIFTLFINVSFVNAASIGNAINSAQSFTNHGQSSIINYSGLYDVINFIYNVLMTVAIIAAIIVGIILGIRIIAGTLDDRADAKKLMVPYFVIVGMFAFGFGIWKAVMELMKNTGII